MGTLIEQINEILTEWDPIGVGKGVANEEYKSYVPLILRSVHTEEILMNCLIDILEKDMGLEYNHSNKQQTDDLQQACKKIIQVHHKCSS